MRVAGGNVEIMNIRGMNEMAETYKSKYLKSTKCKCGCETDNVDPQLLMEFDAVIDKYFGQHEVVVSCVCRCQKHNKAVGGASKSWHLASKTKKCGAVDFNIKGFEASKVQKILDPVWHGGLEYAPTWTHIDIGPHRRFRP